MIDARCVEKDKDYIIISEIASNVAAASNEIFSMASARLSDYTSQTDNRKIDEVPRPPNRTVSSYFGELETYLQDIQDNLNGIHEAFKRAEI